MGQTTIGWTATKLSDGSWFPGWTFNGWHGCLKVSPGCTHCYAEAQTIRFSQGKKIWGPASNTSRRFFGERHWREPLTWNRTAEEKGVRLKVFCASMLDVFEDHPEVVSERQKLWPLIEQTQWLKRLLLTKRPENIMEMTPISWRERFPDNVWVGTSVETQDYAEKLIPALLGAPAVVHFLSCEPLLGRLDLCSWLPRLQWVITGGESGPQHRTLTIDWVRDIREQSLSYDVPHSFKQVGGLHHDSGGRLLDGRTWDQMPEGIPYSGEYERGR